MDEPLQPGELRFSSHKAPQHPRISIRQLVFIVLLMALSFWVGYALLSTPEPLQSSPDPPQTQTRPTLAIETRPMVIPRAPIPPLKQATFSPHWADSTPWIEGKRATRSFGLVNEIVTVIRVESLTDVPSAEQARAIHVKNPESLSTPQFVHTSDNHFIARQTSRSPEFIERQKAQLETFAGASLPRPTQFTNRQQPIIFYGDVDIHTGPLLGSDTGVADILLFNDELKWFNSDLAAGHMPRGPPKLAFEIERGYRPTRTVYVIGKAKTYAGPDLYGHSVIKTRVLDMGVMSNDEESKFTKALKLWHEEAAEVIVNYAVVHPGAAAETASLHPELESFAGKAVTRTASGEFVDATRELNMEQLRKALNMEPLRMTPESKTEQFLRMIEREAAQEHIP